MAFANPTWIPIFLKSLKEHKISLTVTDTMVALNHSEIRMFNTKILLYTKEY